MNNNNKNITIGSYQMPINPIVSIGWESTYLLPSLHPSCTIDNHLAIM